MDDALRAHLRSHNLLRGTVFVVQSVLLWRIPCNFDGILRFQLLLSFNPILRPEPVFRWISPNSRVYGIKKLLPSRVDEVIWLDLLGIFGKSKVHMDNTSTAFLARLSGRWKKVACSSCNAIVKPGSNADEQIAVLDEVVRSGVAMHSQHVGCEGMTLIKCSQSMQGCGHRDLERLSQLHQLFGRVVCPLPSDYEGTFGILDQAHHLRHESIRSTKLARFASLAGFVNLVVIHAAVNRVSVVVVEVVGIMT
mmetsp:Transcript_27568/g.57557  ORF Transcript_27568/g.57557 Transcript_27568/m.57557 type:complete len:251 (+) Transcript_27568:844-1596(+)